MLHVSSSGEVEFARAGKLYTVCLHTALNSYGSSLYLGINPIVECCWFSGRSCPWHISRALRTNVPLPSFGLLTQFCLRCYALSNINPLNPELNPICYLLALLAHHFLHVTRIRVKSLTLRLLMSGRSPAEIVGSNPTGGMDICLL